MVIMFQLKEMEVYYENKIQNGCYSEDNLLVLFYVVIKHRLEHFIKGEGWQD